MKKVFALMMVLVMFLMTLASALADDDAYYMVEIRDMGDGKYVTLDTYIENLSKELGYRPTSFNVNARGGYANIDLIKNWLSIDCVTDVYSGKVLVVDVLPSDETLEDNSLIDRFQSDYLTVYGLEDEAHIEFVSSHWEEGYSSLELRIFDNYEDEEFVVHAFDWKYDETLASHVIARAEFMQLYYELHNYNAGCDDDDD